MDKAAKQAFISQIIADGKLTGKEARKAQKQGISLARIEKAQTRSYKSGNVFSRDKPLEGKELLKSMGTPQGFASSGVRTYHPDSRYQGKTGRSVDRSPTPYSPLIVKKDATTAFNNAPAPYTPEEVTGLINNTIASASVPKMPELQTAPQFMYNEPSLVASTAPQFAPAAQSISRGNPFQRRGTSANLKINKTLNV